MQKNKPKTEIIYKDGIATNWFGFWVNLRARGKLSDPIYVEAHCAMDAALAAVRKSGLKGITTYRITDPIPVEHGYRHMCYHGGRSSW